jgi:two-component system cell cycle sensor histidine kinase PleC
MQAFGQGSLAQQTSEGGTGLGLPIVQSLVRLHGGTFKLRSVLRKGTEAIVWLPRSRVLGAAPWPPAPRANQAAEAPDEHRGADAEPWWRTAAGRASQQATTGC